MMLPFDCGNILVLDMEVSKDMGVSKMVGLKRENPTKIDDLWVPLFQETPIFTHYITHHGGNISNS